MLTNIAIKSLDTIKLNTELCDYEKSHDGTAYLFMNTETLDMLRFDSESLFKECPECSDWTKKGMVGVYQGRKVYVNNDLKFSTVEIR